MIKELVNRMLSMQSEERRHAFIFSIFFYNKAAVFNFQHVISKEDIDVINFYANKVDSSFKSKLSPGDVMHVYFCYMQIEFESEGSTEADEEEEETGRYTARYYYKLPSKKLVTNIDWTY